MEFLTITIFMYALENPKVIDQRKHQQQLSKLHRMSGYY